MDSPPTHRVLLLCDAPLIRFGFERVLAELAPRVEFVCLESGTLSKRLATCPACALGIVDLPLLSGDGLAELRLLHRKRPRLPLLVVATDDSPITAERCLLAGATGYVLKGASSPEILDAARKVQAGVRHVAWKVTGAMLQKHLAHKRERTLNHGTGRLSERELQVFQLIGRGQTTRRIAEELQLERRLIDVFRARIRRKLDLPPGASLAEAARTWTDASS